MSTPHAGAGPAGDDVLVEAMRALGGTSALCAALKTELVDVDGVGLTLFTADDRIVLAVAGTLIDQVEDLQISLDQGPCLYAFQSRVPVLVADLGEAAMIRQWPGFAPRAVAAGIRAVFAFPVLLHGQPIAALDLCRARPGPLSEQDQDAALAYAGAAAMLLQDDVASGNGGGASIGRDTALLLQATGVVMEQAGVDSDTALHRLRRHALDHHQPVADVVTDVLVYRLRFDATPTG